MLNEKGNICVSIIVPTHRLSPERRVDKPAVEMAVNNAKAALQYKYTESNIKPLLEAIDELFDTIDFTHNTEGLGLYVSAQIKLVVHFPFRVDEKVSVGDNFEIRDLLYKASYANPYGVIMLSENEIRLFKGSWDELDEIKDNNFPQKHHEEYIYNPASRGTSYAGSAHVKSFEKDKSELEAIRFRDFFRHTDELLKEYLFDNMPLILLGSVKELAWYESITSYKKNIAGKIPGNYHHTRKKYITEMSWPLMRMHYDNEIAELVKTFAEKIGDHQGIYGIEEVWKAAREGKAFKLLVEKDFRQPGFITSGNNQLFLHPPITAHHILADAVDDIIEMVLKKNGHVYFTGKDMLKDYQQIALITRY
jgi:hypothetical protein